MLSRENILGATDLKFEDVTVEEWKDTDGAAGVVRMTELGADQALKFTEMMSAAENQKEGMYLIVVACAHDTDGNKFFTEEDVAVLKTKNLRVLNRLQRAGLRVNNMLPEAGVALKKALSEAVPDASPIS